MKGRMRYLLPLWCIVMLCSCGATKTMKSSEPKRVYMYGVSMDFNDSTVYLTDLQFLDSIVVKSDASIVNLSSYPLQMKTYLESKLGDYNQTCALFYSPKKRRLEKRYQNVQYKFKNDKDIILKKIGVDEFRFYKE